MSKSQHAYLFIIGLDSEGKAHAARFSPKDLETVRRAADARGYQVAYARSKQAKEAAKRLPEGKLFSTGNALVPRIRPELHATLMAHGAFVTFETPDQVPPPEPFTPHPELAALWDRITIGSIVLCRDPVTEGYYEAEVTGTGIEPDMLMLRWHGWPKSKPLAVHRHKLGLLLSGSIAGAGNDQ